MRLAKALVPALVCLVLGGCFTVSSRMVTTQSPGVQRIPTVIAFFPLLTCPGPAYRDSWEPSLHRGRHEVYLAPPAESQMVVSFNSQMLTNYLAAELSYQGFTLKELPVTANPGAGATGLEHPTFSVSLEQLAELHARYGVEALLTGNVVFTSDPSAPYEKRVRSLYLKLVDIETLEVLCHFFLPATKSGDGMGSVVSSVAEEMARLAHLQPAGPQMTEQAHVVPPPVPEAPPEPEPAPEPAEAEPAETADWEVY